MVLQEKIQNWRIQLKIIDCIDRQNRIDKLYYETSHKDQEGYDDGIFQESILKQLDEYNSLYIDLLSEILCGVNELLIDDEIVYRDDFLKIPFQFYKQNNKIFMYVVTKKETVYSYNIKILK